MPSNLFLCEGYRALQAEVVGGERGDGLAFGGLEGLGHNRRLVEDFPQDYFVMVHRGVRGVLALAEEELDVFCIPIISDWCSHERRGWWRVRSAVPQPNMGVPGAGDLTLTVLGDEGVVGRAAIVSSRPVKSSVLSHEIHSQARPCRGGRCWAARSGRSSPRPETWLNRQR